MFLDFLVLKRHFDDDLSKKVLSVLDYHVVLASVSVYIFSLINGCYITEPKNVQAAKLRASGLFCFFLLHLRKV